MVRGLLLLRARTLAAGYSGVRVELPRRLLELLDRGLLPVIPGKGSVGASGDLAQLAHLALPLVGEGRLRRGRRPDLRGRPSAELLAEEGLEPLVLAAKEGLSPDQRHRADAGAAGAGDRRDRAAGQGRRHRRCAMSLEALLGTNRAYDERVQVIRPHPGQLASAAQPARAARRLARWSPATGTTDHAVQDSYCLRCAPQVHGAVRDVLAHARRVIDIELGSVVDNPVIVPGRRGHVDRQLPRRAAGLRRRHARDRGRRARLASPSGAPTGCSTRRSPAACRRSSPRTPARTRGYMIAQYTAASLVSENKVLAHPASVDTIPTSGNQEDHVSMGWTSMRKLREVVANVRAVLAVEIAVRRAGARLPAPTSPRPGAGDRGGARAAARRTCRRCTVDRDVAAQIDAVDALLPRPRRRPPRRRSVRSVA